MPRNRAKSAPAASPPRRQAHVRIAVYGTLLLLAALLYAERRVLWRWAVSGILAREQTVEGVVARHKAGVRARFEKEWKPEGIAWPPRRLTLIACKRERTLEVWGADAAGPYTRLKTYPILGASGDLGPKRREGDMQVPEGFYRLTVLNPNSAHHLSVRVDYPNREDIAHAAVPRGQMGGDIYVHGGSASVGCIAIGDPAIEEVFTLVALSDGNERRILISPVDFRTGAAAPKTDDAWVTDLYRRLRAELRRFPRK